MLVDILWATLLVLVLLLCWVGTLVGLPGNWAAVGAAALYAWLAPATGRPELGWPFVLLLLLLAGVGELLEMLAGMLGAAQVGASKRAAAMALVGSLLGAMLGLTIGFPIPVVGQVLGAIVFAGGGALAGAMLGEFWKGKDWRETWQSGKAAFWGRIFGTLGKILVGSAMVALAVGALLI